MQTEKKQDTSDREIRISRVLKAPRELVWEVWTNPKHIEKWWGPNEFTNTISVMDVQTGGEWNLVMHSPDGTDYKNKSIFKEIVKPERLVYEHISVPKFTATIEFIADGDNTLLKWHMLFETRDLFENVVKTFKADEGLKQNVEKLEQYLAQEVNTKMNNQPIVVERTFNAPINKVWKAITDKEEMRKWYFDLSAFKPEIGFKFEFTGGEKGGKQYRHLCEITEIIPEKKLTYSWRYDGFPGNSFVTFELFEQEDKTLLKLTHEGVETFPTDDPNFHSGSFKAGWNHIINISLKNYLD